ncbi:MAG: hypothetical protein KAI24_03410, partial [Planctomycetes bacterium]|nr:hypothetical protein [Planctomycetota bacterium]
DPERAAGALLHFFEAFGEFWATVLISALEQEREIPGPRTTEIRSQIEAYGIHPLERSSMKTWEFVGGKIASWLRKQVLASAGAGAEPLLDPLRCLATRDRTVLDALLSREIVTILSRVGAMRNTERGHGGASSPQAARVLLDRLRSELLQLREVVAPVFDRLKLYRLGRADVLRGVIAYTVEVLQGSNAAFLKRELRLEDHPEKGSLVLSAGEGRCLVLVPLILMGPPKDASNACYFYNRTEAGTARFVSYHQGDKVEDHRVEPLAFLERWQQDFDGECVSS